MSDILIPIKKLSCAKRRLSGAFSVPERSGLVLAMLEDLLAVATTCDSGHVWVIASDEAVFDLARGFGCRPIREKWVRGYNAAVALGLSAVDGTGGVAIIPGDVPLVTPSEIAALTEPAKTHTPTVRLVASRDGTGTNGLFLSSKLLLPPAFGSNSFARYRAASRSAGIAPAHLDAPGLAHDIDTPEDLYDFERTATHGSTYRFIRARHRVDAPRDANEGAAA